MKRMVDQPLGPSKTLALTSVKVLEILSGLKISQRMETHIGGMWEGAKGESIFISKTFGSTSATTTGSSEALDGAQAWAQRN